jgi:hypothetical protein
MVKELNKMTPKEKADEIFEKMLNKVYLLDKMPWRDVSKKCTLIAVDEIINSVDDEHVSDIFKEHWQQVKQEIEKL